MFNHITILHIHVSVTLVIIIRVAYNKNTVNLQIMEQKCMKEPIDVTLDFSEAFIWSQNIKLSCCVNQIYISNKKT